MNRKCKRTAFVWNSNILLSLLIICEQLPEHKWMSLHYFLVCSHIALAVIPVTKLWIIYQIHQWNTVLSNAHKPVYWRYIHIKSEQSHCKCCKLREEHDAWINTGFKWAKPVVLQYWDELLECNAIYSVPSADPGCGGVFTDTEGIIISPNWPNNYAHDRQCIYIIRMPRSEQVALNFTHMDLETHSGCLFDFVEVWFV